MMFKVTQYKGKFPYYGKRKQRVISKTLSYDQLGLDFHPTEIDDMQRMGRMSFILKAELIVIEPLPQAMEALEAQ